MTSNRFTAEELAVFEDQFRRVPVWKRWSRKQTAEGGEVLQITLASQVPATLTIAKTDDGHYAATGFDGWSLTICDALPPLLEILARMIVPARPQPSRAASIRPAA